MTTITLPQGTAPFPSLKINPNLIVITALSIGVITFSTCYAISIHQNFITPPDYFLSRAINYPPASSIGVFGITLSIGCFLPLSFLRYALIEQAHPNLKMNIFSISCSLVAILGGFIVACFPLSSDKTAHYTGAFLFFSFSLVVVLSQIYLDRATDKKHTTGAKSRVVLGVVCSLSIIALFVQGSLYNEFSGHLVMSICQITYFAASLSLYGSFLLEFQDVKLKLIVVNKAEE